jgi:hypothetical protein
VKSSLYNSCTVAGKIGAVLFLLRFIVSGIPHIDVISRFKQELEALRAWIGLP